MGRTRLSLLGLLVGSILGCSRPAAPSAEKGTASPPEVAADVARPAPSPAAAPSTFCTVGLPEAWTSALREGTVPFPSDARVVPITGAADGSRLFAAYYSPSWSGVVSVAPRTGALTRLRAFSNPGEDQVLSGAFDGRYLAWFEGHSRRNWNDWTLRAWDSRGDRVFDVAIAPRNQGQLVQGPLVSLVVSNGMLGWVQANPAGRGEMHLYSLARRRDRVLSSGTAAPPVTFWGSNVLWQELDVPGQSGHLAMASASSGEPIKVPEPLASIRHLAYLTTSGDLVAWSDTFSVWTWRPGEQEPRQLVGGADNLRPQFLASAGHLMTWDDVRGPMVADLRSGSMARLTESYGGRFASGKALLVFQPRKGAPPTTRGLPLQTAMVDVSSLPPLPACGP